MRVYSRSKPRKIRAGRVKITPDAIDCPEFPVVCTMLFSRMEARPNARSRLMESTEMGMDAPTVKPCAQPHIDGDRAKEQSKNAAQDQGAGCQFGAGLGGWNKRLERLGRCVHSACLRLVETTVSRKVASI